MESAEPQVPDSFELAPVGMAHVSPEGDFLRVNAALCAMTGYAREELTGMNIARLTVEEERPQAESARRQMLAGDRASWSTEKRYRRRDGTTFFGALATTLVRGPGARPGYFISVIQDVTARHEAEQALRASEAQFASAFEHAPIGLALVAPDGRWLKVNAALCAMLGCTAEEMLAGNFQGVTHPDDLADDHRLRDQLLRGEIATYQKQKRYLHASGAVVWAHISVTLVRDASGRPLHFISQIQDVTRAREVAESLAASEAEFRTIFELAGIGLAKVDFRDGRLLRCNASLAAMLGYGIDELCGLTVGDVSEPEDFARDFAQWNEMVEGKRDRFQMEKRYRRKDGSNMWGLLTSTMVRGPAGEPRFIIGMVEDIDERKRAGEALVRLNAELEQRVRTRTAELEQANRDLESFSYSVSHDLRAPLTAIDGYASMVLAEHGESLPDAARAHLEKALRAVSQMEELIEGLLAFSRLSRIAIEARPVDMDSLVRSALEEVALQHAGRRPEVRVGPLPACRGDRLLLRQAWVNLLSNAFKYSGRKDAPVVEVGSRQVGDEQVFYIRDNGAGFDMRYAHKLFAVFERLHGRGEFPGTGVGLAIVQRIVQGHGGRIWAEAAEGEGATFYFTLGKASCPEAQSA